MKVISLKLVVVSLAFLLVGAVGAQTDQIVTLPDGSKAVLKADKTWEPLPKVTPSPRVVSSMRDFIPDDPRDVFLTILNIKGQFDKSEFETEQQYLARIDKLTAETKSSPTSNRRLSEVVFIFRNLASYNAEAQEFKFEMTDIYRNARLDPIRPNGSKYQVMLYERTRGQWSPDVLGPSNPPIVRMPGEKAAMVKPALALAVYGAAVGIEWNGNGPAIVKLLPARLLAYNVATGEIYGETDLRQPPVKMLDRPTSIYQ